MYVPEIFVILLNYNGAEDTVECVESLKKAMFSRDYKLKICIVDNKSDNEDLKKIIDYGVNNLSVNIIRNDKNIGYAGGNNVGISYAIKNKADYIWVLNNDVIVDIYSISNLLNTAKHNNAFYSSKIFNYYNKEELMYCGAEIRKNFDVVFKNINITCNISTDFLSGASIFAHRSLWEKYKLPEEYFLYEEDLDFSLNLKQEKIPMYIVADAKIYHKESVSTNKLSYIKYYYLQRNKLMLINKYAKNPWKTCFFIKKFFIFPFRTIRRLIKGIFLNREYIYYTKYECKAFYDFLRGKVGKFDD